MEGVGRWFKMVQMAMKASMGVLSIRAHYFMDVTDQGLEEDRNMSLLFEQGHGAEFYESYRT